MNAPSLEVLYTCHRCRTIERVVVVREREAEEPVVKWFEMVRDEIGADHAHHAPFCRATHIDMVKIPVPKEATRLGEAQRQ